MGSTPNEAVSSYLNEIRRYQLLTEHEEKALGKRISEGDESARELLITSNLRIVISIASNYRRFAPLADLIQEGNIGLMHAVGKYDYTKPYRFSTYAVWWIRQVIQRYVDNCSRTIRTPIYMVHRINRVNRTYDSLTALLGISPTNEQIASELSISEKKVEAAFKAMSVAQTLSLEDEFTDTHNEKNLSLADLQKDDADGPYEHAVMSELERIINKLLSLLEPKEASVLRSRIGFADGNSHLLREIGAELGVTRERVRQIEAQAIEQLRYYLSYHPNASALMEHLKSF